MELLILVAFGLGLYFIPSIVALNRGRETAGVILLNLFLGWTLIGWVAALVWAASGKSTNATPPPRASRANLLQALQPQSTRITGRLMARAASLNQALIEGHDEGDPTSDTNSLVEPVAAIITYQAADGAPSKRLISLRRMGVTEGGHTILTAYCHLRGATRNFRADRISTLVDADSGEVFDTPDAIMAWLNACADCDLGPALDGLTVLMFIAAADGKLSGGEVAAMARYAIATMPGLVIGPDFSTRLARMAPSGFAALASLEAALKSQGPRDLLAAIEAMIAADDHVHSAEKIALAQLKLVVSQA